jgi:uncharacterized protein YebE (UPF0316 family)
VSLRQASYGVTIVDAQGISGPVHVIYTMILRKQLADVVGIIEQSDASTFYSIEDLRSANGGFFQIEQAVGQINSRERLAELVRKHFRKAA